VKRTRKLTVHLGADNVTGTVDYPAVAGFVAGNWEGATIIPGWGVYKGKVEQSAMMVVYTDANDDEMDAFCEGLRKRFDQEAVYSVVEEI